ncbi:cold shock and DUF1294 domain-containing protein [Simiduia curdlanivorans]|uniref:DUF1294 domain-containing protein n=1 Tax=Simiduia curdlanivorans TaxID=1492769 RepID=A0ABV8V076_9GAMM|nr:cold shock and DUF1294 domain-containing protein [Simiduia curdlanivorans]MDN3637841.1 cold shock and DUF1294 domain-containing protein [Simiduia curdlanivorans]
MDHSGKLISWNLTKGFGFVQPKYGGKDIFVHISDFLDASNTPQAGQAVTFTLSTDGAGRPCGKNVARLNDRKPTAHSHFSGNLSVALAILFTFAVSYSALRLKMPIAILWLYLAINCLTFTLYITDKAAAKSGAWRTQERSLHMLALLGGWPGAAFAQQIFQHKTKKLGFRFVYWLTVLLNIAGFWWLLTPNGQAFLAWLVGAIG